MRVVLGLLLVLLGLCGSGAQGEGGGLSEVGELSKFQKTDPRDAVEESSEQTNTDIWAEMRALRDMVVDELKAELMVTKVHVELLQRENSAQATELKSLETRLTATESKTSDLQKQNADLQARLSSSESELLVSKSRIDELERENAAQAAELKSLETRLTATESKTSDLQKLKAETPKVAFYAALTTAGYVGPYNTEITLKYSNVFTNFGNDYNPATGFFTAPVRGVYYFQFTMFGNLQNNMGVYVYKNGQKIMYNGEWGHDGSVEYFTNSLILDLRAGDEIYLRLPSGNAVYDDGSNYCTFSGALLFTL